MQSPGMQRAAFTEILPGRMPSGEEVRLLRAAATGEPNRFAAKPPCRFVNSCRDRNAAPELLEGIWNCGWDS